jgi:DUF4097 and DUF4098 domain-containing protein YvlB
MASPAQVPPPQIPPPQAPRSLAGPVVLIVVGVVFLLGTMGVLHWYMLGRWFAHYWPLLIILWGVIKLVEHQRAQQSGMRSRGIGAGGVFLLIMLICFGLIATQASRFNWEEIRDQMNVDNSDFPIFGHTYNYDDQLEQAFPAGASLNVTDDRGAVNITTSTDNQIHVSVHKRLNADSQEGADKRNTETKPQITVANHTVNLNANTQGSGDHWVVTDLDISLPRGAPVVVSTHRGDVSVLGRDGDVDISNQHGTVAVSDINGKVSLHLERSSARISQVSSDVSVEGRADDVSVEDVKGSVRLNGDFTESLKLARIAKGTSFKSSRTEIGMSQLNGTLNLDSGDLEGSGLVGPVRLETRSKDIRLSGISGDLRLDDTNGAVEIHVSKLGNLQVSNRQGDIQLYLPEKAGFQLDARARNGEIQSDFGGLKISNADDQALGSGTVGGGGPRLTLNNEHGTIEIRRGLTAAATPPAPPSPKSPPQPPEATEN